MTHQLESVFGELGISQYLDAFLENGFDSWETILDIIESDLDALGVKLGHRRKLQRRIANSRGLAPDASLVSPTQPSIEEARFEPLKPEAPRVEAQIAGPPVISKRKYRRHPKPDDNAPERPPSAYVLFSNKMREELKGRNLTFTEIAKLVGENWQNLSQAEKEPFETQAQTAKESYNRDLGEYKKTPQYKKYIAYLQDFRAKHAHRQDRDASKRLKLSESANYSGTSASGTPNRTSRSGSGSESQVGSEPPPSRSQRVGSVVSVTEPLYPATVTPGSQHASMDDPMNSPLTISAERRSAERSPTFSAGSPRDFAPMHARRNSKWELDRSDQNGPRNLPPLSDMFDARDTHLTPPALEGSNAFPFYRGQLSESPGPVPGLAADGRPPSLRTEQSSNGSTSSTLSSSYPRTPLEGPSSSLPIHALLTTKPPSFEAGQQLPVFPSGPIPVPVEHKRAPYMQYPVIHSNPPALTNDECYPTSHQIQQHRSVERLARPSNSALYSPESSSTGYHHHTTPVPHQPRAPGQHGNPAFQPPATSPMANGVTPQGPKQETNLDGMSALLRAGEIVNRREIP